MSQSFDSFEPIADIDLPGFLIEKENAQAEMPRRQFLKLSGIVGGGLALGVFGLDVPSANAADSVSAKDFAPNGYIKIDPQGVVTLFAKMPEIGQGVKTSIPMIVAEELDVPWDSVVVEQAPINKEVYGRQAAGGSTSIPSSYNALRQAGATARQMLINAAAKQWGVEPGQCETAQGYVINSKNGKRLSYGELASLAATLPVPVKNTVKLKQSKDFNLIGKRIGGVDNHALVTGQPLFGMDQQLPNMVYASYVKCPMFGGKVKSANLNEVKALPGVLDAFVLNGVGVAETLVAGVAIIAESTHHAFQAQQALKVDWDKGTGGTDSWSGLEKKAKELAKDLGPKAGGWGDVEAALDKADETVEAFYSYPFLAHSPMEPQNCTAWYHGGKMEVWAPSQTPQNIPDQVATAVDVKPKDIEVHQLRIGGGFGRRLMNDFVVEACAIARRLDKPVKLVWTREQDMAHDFYRVGGFHSLKAGLSKKGKLLGINDHFISFGEEKPVRAGNLSPAQMQFPSIPSVRVAKTLLPLDTPTGWWRAPQSCSLAWVFQSFLHELSTTAKRDHVEFLLEQLGKPRHTGKGTWRDIHTGRAIDVINAVVEKSDWGKPLDKGRGRGISFYFSHQGYFAEVAEVTVDKNKNVTVDNVVVVGDVGRIINRSCAENQVEGSIVDAISVLAGQKITMEDGAVQQSNFHDYPLLRMPKHPKIDVHWLESDKHPTGLGEPAFPPLAAAVTNAIFDATGERIREMPISSAGFSV